MKPGFPYLLIMLFVMILLQSNAQSTEGTISATWDFGAIQVNDREDMGSCPSVLFVTLPSTKDFYRIKQIDINADFESISPVFISEQSLRISSALIPISQELFDLQLGKDYSGVESHEKTISSIVSTHRIQEPGAELMFTLAGRQTFFNTEPNCSMQYGRILGWTVQITFCIDDADCDDYPYYNDCNDNWASINPAASESTCNGVDDDCDGLVDENVTINTFNGSVSNQWFDPHNWSLEHIPHACERAVILGGQSVILGGRVPDDFIVIHSLEIVTGGELVTSFIEVNYVHEVFVEQGGSLSCGPSSEFINYVGV